MIEYLTKVSGYQFEQKDSKKGNDWKVILKWWMDCNAIITKKPSDITKWHKFVRENFIYRASWGIGSIVALASNEVLGNQPTDFTLANWPLVGLP